MGPAASYAGRIRRNSFLILLYLSAVHAANFTHCLEKIRSFNASTAADAGVRITDNSGHVLPLSDSVLHDATAISYGTCLSVCGSGPMSFAWDEFSQLFSAWLLPWLALISQLPFGGRHRIDNVVSIMLAVGSPALAGYSLVLTVLNSHWVMRRFHQFKQPRSGHAMHALRCLQQAPLKVLSFDLVNTLVVLRENDSWWDNIVERLDYKHTWSVSAVTNLIWVSIAFLFIVIDAFRNLKSEDYNVRGESVGVVWLWLLPVVVGWLQISPKCDAERIEKAMHDTNTKAYHVVTSDGIINGDAVPTRLYAVSLYDEGRGAVYDDEQCTSPIYNYARVFTWAHAAEAIAMAYQCAEERVGSGESSQLSSHTGSVGHTYSGVACGHSYHAHDSLRAPGVWKRISAASVMGLLLLWSTTGAAFMLSWLTPTQGLGCRAGTYLVYGVVATIVWLFMFISSILVRCEVMPTDVTHSVLSANPRLGLPGLMAISLRRIAKVLAAGNTIWIICGCIFQFSGFYNRCWCNSSVMSWGARAFSVLQTTESDVSYLHSTWAGGVVLSAVSSIFFYLFLNLYLHEPPRGR